MWEVKGDGIEIEEEFKAEEIGKMEGRNYEYDDLPSTILSKHGLRVTTSILSFNFCPLTCLNYYPFFSLIKLKNKRTKNQFGFLRFIITSWDSE